MFPFLHLNRTHSSLSIFCTLTVIYVVNDLDMIPNVSVCVFDSLRINSNVYILHTSIEYNIYIYIVVCVILHMFMDQLSIVYYNMYLRLSLLHSARSMMMYSC